MAKQPECRLVHLGEAKPPTPEEMVLMERSFRRGYRDGAIAALEAFRDGASLDAIEQWANETLLAWKLSDNPQWEVPPDAPQGRKR